MKASTTKLSMDRLRAEGWEVEVVEHWRRNPVTGVQTKHDLFGILDILAVRDDETMGVQTTSRAHLPGRLKKIAAAAITPKLQRAGWRIMAHGWWQPRGPGTRYECEEVEVVDTQEPEQQMFVVPDAAVRRHPSNGPSE